MSVEEGKFKELTVRFRGEVLEREREREPFITKLGEGRKR